MVDREFRTAILVPIACFSFTFFSRAQTAAPQAANSSPQLKIVGAVSTPLTLTAADLKNMPRTTLHVTNPHENKSETYEGVLLEELLRRAGAPLGEPALWFFMRRE